MHAKARASAGSDADGHEEFGVAGGEVVGIAESVDGGSGGTEGPAAGAPAVGEHGGAPGGGMAGESVDPPFRSLQLPSGHECADLLHAEPHTTEVRGCQQSVLAFRRPGHLPPPLRTHTL